jgi:hypothetical protein
MSGKVRALSKNNPIGRHTRLLGHQQEVLLGFLPGIDQPKVHVLPLAHDAKPHVNALVFKFVPALACDSQYGKAACDAAIDGDLLERKTYRELKLHMTTALGGRPKRSRGGGGERGYEEAWSLI